VYHFIILSKFIQFVKIHQNDIILLIGVILISLLSFAMGYIVAKEQEKEPIRIEQNIHEFRCEFYTNDMRIDYLYIRTDS
jgi:hypothetical protein